MAAKAYGFSEDGARRIGAVVRKVEAELPHLRQRRRQRNDPPPLFYLGKTTTSHAKGDTEDVDLYAGTTKGSETMVDTQPAYNRCADLDDDIWVYLIWIGGGYEILQAEC